MPQYQLATESDKSYFKTRSLLDWVSASSNDGLEGTNLLPVDCEDDC